MDTRVLLLLTLSTCMALAQNMGRSERCICRRVRERFGQTKLILDIQIFPPSNSCNRLEIVVSLKNGLQYCLNPEAQNVQKIITSIIEMRKKKAAPRQSITTSPSSSDE